MGKIKGYPTSRSRRIQINTGSLDQNINLTEGSINTNNTPQTHSEGNIFEKVCLLIVFILLILTIKIYKVS